MFIALLKNAFYNLHSIAEDKNPMLGKHSHHYIKLRTAIRVWKWNYFCIKHKFQRIHHVRLILKLENQTVEICLGYRPSPSVVFVEKVTSDPSSWPPASSSSPSPHPTTGSWSPWPSPHKTSAHAAAAIFATIRKLAATRMVGLGSLTHEAKLLLKGSN